MDCRNFQKSLEDYLDGGLDFAGRFGVERHAEQCLVCGKKLADARRLQQLTASLARVKAPVDFEARLCQEIARRKSHGFFARLRDSLTCGFDWFTWPAALSWTRLASVATICVVLGFGISLYRYLNQETPSLSASSPVAPVVNVPAAVAQIVVAEQAEQMTEQPETVVSAETAAPVILPASPVVPVAEVVNPPEPGNTLSALQALQAMVTENSELSPELSGPRNRPRAEAVNLMLLGPDYRTAPERLPQRIYYRYGPPSEEHFIMNVSH